MNVIIIEDEPGAAENLKAVIKEVDSSINILSVIESIKDAVQWISTNPLPDLAFCDIQLADGICFELFNQIRIEFPVIFTTAYDQYAIQAFKVNSIDYLLKPVQQNDLDFALKKFQKNFQNRINIDDFSKIMVQIGSGSNKNHKKTFLVHYQFGPTYVSRDRVCLYLLKLVLFYHNQYHQQA